MRKIKIMCQDCNHKGFIDTKTRKKRKIPTCSKCNSKKFTRLVICGVQQTIKK